MSETKKYYWLKLKTDFFGSRAMKKLRRIAGGDTYTIIYLKMQLLSLKNNGTISFEGVEPTLAEEIALEIDEDLENVVLTIQFLINVGLLELSDKECFLPEAVQNTGSESSSAERVRRYRLKQDSAALQCNTDVTNSNTEIEKSKEKRREDIDPAVPASVPKKKQFVPPTVQEVSDYCKEKGYEIDPEYFVSHYAANGWRRSGGQKIVSWKDCVVTWVKNKDRFGSPAKKNQAVGSDLARKIMGGGV